MNFDRWVERIYTESDFGRSIATTGAGVAALATYLYWSDWWVSLCVGIIVFPVGKIGASAFHSHRVQTREKTRGRERMSDLLENLGREEKAVVQEFVWHGSKFVSMQESHELPNFASDGIDSLVSRKLVSVTGYSEGTREGYVLDTEMFEYAQSVLPNDPF